MDSVLSVMPDFVYEIGILALLCLWCCSFVFARIVCISKTVVVHLCSKYSTSNALRLLDVAREWARIITTCPTSVRDKACTYPWKHPPQLCMSSEKSYILIVSVLLCMESVLESCTWYCFTGLGFWLLNHPTVFSLILPITTAVYIRLKNEIGKLWRTPDVHFSWMVYCSSVFVICVSLHFYFVLYYLIYLYLITGLFL